ncbi:hypothetical protein B566_EDAN004594 [Ephemera danica]|nr:hypothetical protein B566_EDAN004594 [Ephemera danica]
MSSARNSEMAAIVNNIVYAYDTFTHKWADDRTRDWFLAQSPIPPIIIVILYLKFVKDWGPKFMKDRKPFELKWTLIVYNAFQVAFSVYLFKEMANAVWMYYMAKYTELLDTVFFVLRKKQNQVSFLHLYHHCMMIVCGYIGTKFLAGGHGTFLGLINSFVHIIMYGYYLLAALGPQYQKYLWWKRHITRMQMVQFCMVFLHGLLILNKECNYPKYVVVLLCPNAIFFYFLFYDFYQAAYDKSKKA